MFSAYQKRQTQKLFLHNLNSNPQVYKKNSLYINYNAITNHYTIHGHILFTNYSVSHTELAKREGHVLLFTTLPDFAEPTACTLGPRRERELTSVWPFLCRPQSRTGNSTQPYGCRTSEFPHPQLLITTRIFPHYSRDNKPHNNILTRVLPLASMQHLSKFHSAQLSKYSQFWYKASWVVSVGQG